MFLEFITLLLLTIIPNPPHLRNNPAYLNHFLIHWLKNLNFNLHFQNRIILPYYPYFNIPQNLFNFPYFKYIFIYVRYYEFYE